MARPGDPGRECRRGLDVRIGTSGWIYKHGRGTFYPQGLRIADQLDHCTERDRVSRLRALPQRGPGPALRRIVLRRRARPWVGRLRELTGADAAGARPAHVSFYNDNHGHAAFNALTLRRMAEAEA
ncbi:MULTISPECIES: hypothetical protein [Micrococcus]|uniref:hypothetical protein n=1 Tax=Micrococcus TaxID=1269 RepID=UPI00128DB91D|nr:MULTISPECIES: hypothetical protein [Micrococcus]MCV7501159.1 hypothetical protein [Micrococcus luteus]MCV7740863.1 hypothetical protein [Micrococcus luteus]